MAQWKLAGSTGVLAVHAALLHNGKIIYFAGDEHDPHRVPDPNVPPSGPVPDASLDTVRLYDCATGTVAPAPAPRIAGGSGRVIDLFCAGHCLLPDGRLLVVGGTANPYWPLWIPAGIADSVVFDPTTATWATTGSLQVARWYPTLVTTQRRVLCFGGTGRSDADPISLPEVMSLAAPLTWGVANDTDPNVHFHHVSWYPRLHLLPSGEIFCTNQAWDRQPGGGHTHTQYGDTFSYSSVTDRWADHAALGDGPIVDGHEGGTSVLLPLLPPRYEARVLACGFPVPQRVELARDAGAVWHDWCEIDSRPVGPWKALAVLSRHAGDASIYVVGSDDRLHTAYWTGAWSRWSAMPAVPGAGAVAGMVVQRRSPDHCEVYAVRGARVWRSTWTSAAPAWSAWQALDGPAGLQPDSLAAMTRGPGDASQYVVGADGVYTRWEGSSAWAKLTAAQPAWAAGTRLTAHREDASRVWLFAVDAAGVLQHTRWSTAAPAWSAWSPVAAPAGVQWQRRRVAALSRHVGDVSLYAIDTTGAVWTTWLSGAAFAPWIALGKPGGAAADELEILSRHRDDASLYALDTAGAVHSTFWKGAWNPWFKLPDHGRLRGPAAPGLPVTGALAYGQVTPLRRLAVLSRHADDASIYALHQGRAVSSWWSRAPRWQLDPRASWKDPDGTTPLSPPWRRHACAVLLPTGEVFVGGGVKADRNETHLPGVSGENYAINAAEIYDPEAPAGQRWRMSAAATVNRNYHSVALLMPDGRVFTAGSSKFGKYAYQAGSFRPEYPDTHVDGKIDNRELRIEIFEPDYVANPDRPVITSAPADLPLGGEIAIATPDAARITRVAIVRCGSTTHAFDGDQRYVVLAHQATPGQLRAQAPPDANVAPPGYYLLYVLRGGPGAWVPSTGRFIRVS